MISGNIASYSWSLNNPDALANIAETNELASCLAQVSSARDINKEAAKEKKAAEERERERKKANYQLEFESKKGELHDKLVAEVNKGIEHLCSLKKNKLLLLLRFYFAVKVTNMTKKSHDELMELVEATLDTLQKQVVEGEIIREQGQV